MGHIYLFCVPCCLLAWTDVFLWYCLPLSAAAPAVVSKTEMNVLVRNPEIVFVADLTRADAPALVMTTQCELQMKSGEEGSQMTAAIKDLKVCIVTVKKMMKELKRWIACLNNKYKITVVVVILGCGLSLLEREEEKQRDHSPATLSGVLPEYSRVPNIPSGYGGLHQCSHPEGSSWHDPRNLIWEINGINLTALCTWCITKNDDQSISVI